MAEILENAENLDNIPLKQNIEIEIVKMEDSLLKSIKELNDNANRHINDFGQIYLRKKELNQELINIDEILEKQDAEFKEINNKLKELGDDIDDKYPQARIDLVAGTITYQPGALTRKQQMQQQLDQAQQPK
jgi:predicted nuclease with TOPRIM domain